jgi:hypothetical protein
VAKEGRAATVRETHVAASKLKFATTGAAITIITAIVAAAAGTSVMRLMRGYLVLWAAPSEPLLPDIAIRAANQEYRETVPLSRDGFVPR